MPKSIVQMYQEKARQGARPSTTEVATREMQLFYSVMGELPNPDPILRKAGKHIAVYNELLYDDQVGHSVETLELSIQAMPWEIDGSESGDTLADEVKAMMEDWDHERIFGEIASARLFGFAPLEVRWKMDGRRWEISDIVGKPQEWFFYNNENELRFRKRGTTKGVELPPYSFIIPRNKPSYANPYGVAALSRCFWPVAFKKGGLKFWMKMLEKFGIPYIIGKQPRGTGKEETDKLLDSLEAMIQDAVGVIPDDSSVDILEAAGKGTSGNLFESMVRYHDQAISKAIQGQTLTSGQGDGTGSYALGKEHRETFDNVQAGIMKMISRSYNEAIKWYMQLNHGNNVPVPTFSWVAEEDVQEKRADRDKTLADTGQIWFTKEYWKRRYTLDDDEFEVREQPQPGQGLFSAAEKLPLKKGGTGGVKRGCSCCGDDPIIHFENALAEEFPAAADLEEATEDTNAQKRRLQMMAQEALAPVIEYVNGATTYNQVMTALAGLYPEMDAHELEERLARAMFVAEVWGRISVDEEDVDEE